MRKELDIKDGQIGIKSAEIYKDQSHTTLAGCNIATSETKEHILTHPFSHIIYKMHIILLVARTMMQNGADSDRTWQYIMRTAAYMGIPAENISCHISYTTIMLNIKDEQLTYTRFSKCRTHRVNMLVLSAVSRLIWRAMRDAWSLEHFEREIKNLEKRKAPYNNFLTALGAGFACAGSCALFGCDLAAFFITAAASFLGFYVRRFCNEHGFNVYAGIAIAAFAATFAAVFLQAFDISATPMLSIVACTLFIVPGVPLINAANDLLNHFITSGMTRAFDTLLIVCSTAFGMAIALRLGHISEYTTVSLSPGEIYFYHPLAAAIAAAGFSMIFSVPRRLLWVVSTGGIITILLRNICMFELGMSQAAGTFLGSSCVGVLALFAIHWFHTPNIVLTIPSAIPLIPGVLLYRFFFTILNINEVSTDLLLAALRNGVEAATIIAGITIGVAIPNIFWSRQIKKNKREQEKKLLASRFIDQED